MTDGALSLFETVASGISKAMSRSSIQSIEIANNESSRQSFEDVLNQEYVH